jgi:hypothetical protein
MMDLWKRPENQKAGHPCKQGFKMLAIDLFMVMKEAQKTEA